MITPALKGPRIDQSTVPSLFNIFAETTSNLAFRDKVALIDKEGPVCTFYELENIRKTNQEKTFMSSKKR